MSERDSVWPPRKGYALKAERLSANAYRLLCCFFASEELGKLSTGRAFCPFTLLRDNHQEDEIVRLLIDLAVFVRMAHEYTADSLLKVGPEPSLGKLFEPQSQRTPAPLSLREACNKIIHAQTIRFDVRTSRRRGWHSHLAPRIYLHGEKSGTKWRAVLEVTKFVESAAHLSRGI
jgi:hypothetical protein